MSAYHNPAGVPARVINLWRDEKIILCVSPPLTNTAPGCVPGDADDEKFLECAVVAKAGYVVSGDKHLLAQNGYRKVRVLKPADFARKLA